jgi:hypothetical protein
MPTPEQPDSPAGANVVGGWEPIPEAEPYGGQPDASVSAADVARALGEAVTFYTAEAAGHIVLADWPLDAVASPITPVHVESARQRLRSEIAAVDRYPDLRRRDPSTRPTRQRRNEMPTSLATLSYGDCILGLAAHPRSSGALSAAEEALGLRPPRQLPSPRTPRFLVWQADNCTSPGTVGLPGLSTFVPDLGLLPGYEMDSLPAYGLQWPVRDAWPLLNCSAAVHGTLSWARPGGRPPMSYPDHYSPPLEADGGYYVLNRSGVGTIAAYFVRTATEEERSNRSLLPALTLTSLPPYSIRTDSYVMSRIPDLDSARRALREVGLSGQTYYSEWRVWLNTADSGIWSAWPIPELVWWESLPDSAFTDGADRPHTSSTSPRSPALAFHKAARRAIRVQCGKCAYEVRVPAGFAEWGLPKCPQGHPMLEVSR